LHLQLSIIMDKTVKNISGRIKILLLNPKEFWRARKLSGENQRQLLARYFFPLIILVSAAVFVGEYISSKHFYASYAVAKSGRTLILFTLQYFISIFFTYELIKPFGGKKDLPVVQKLVVYSLTPFLLVSLISGLFPVLYALNVLGLYGFYIFWVGVQENLDFPERKVSSYILTAILVNFFMFSFLSIFLSKLITAYI